MAMKSCPSCSEGCGPRTLTCPKCGYAFGGSETTPAVQLKVLPGARRVKIMNLNDGASFVQPELKAHGVRVRGNECDVKVLVTRPGASSADYELWSPFTEVLRAA
jgi:hypothetical protein